MKRIALIAGGGKLPLIFANQARSCGDYVVGLALEGLTSAQLEPCVDKIYWGNITEINRALEIFQSEKIDYLVMTGRIPKALVFNRDLNKDKIASEVLRNTIDNKDYTVMKAIALRLKKEGISMMDPTPYLAGLIPQKGMIASRPPTKKEWEDIRFGEKMARRIAGMDIGQAVVIKRRLVAAVEAIEGTDETIRRSGTLVGEGAVVLKVARPHQDMRFDIPTIGPETIDAMIAAKATALAVEAKKTLIINRDEIIRKADAAGIAVVAI